MLRSAFLPIIGCCAFRAAAAAVPASLCGDGSLPGLSLGYYAYDSAEVQPTAGTTEVDRYSVDLVFRAGNYFSYGAAYRGTHLNESGIDLQTNGYLHTFLLPLQAKFGSSHSGWRFSVAPVLSGSSNVVKDPDEWAADAWQLLAAIVGDRALTPAVKLRYGICADHVFGDYRVYPTVGVDWEISERWKVQIGFPQMLMTYSWSDSLATLVSLAPAGNSWLVKDRSLENQSQLEYEAWSVDWQVRWTISGKWRLAVSLGREFDSAYEATLNSGQRLSLDAEPTLRLGLQVSRLWQLR